MLTPIVLPGEPFWNILGYDFLIEAGS